MKYFLPLLVLALSQVAFIQAAFSVIDPANYSSNPQVEESLNFGGEYVVQLGINRTLLPEDNYQISQISKIEQDVLVNGANYRFNVNIASDEGVKVAAVYTTYHRFSNNAIKVVSYQYNYTFPNVLKNSTHGFTWENYEFIPDNTEEPTEEPTEGGEGEGESPVETEWPGETEWPVEGECPGENEWPGEGEGETPGEEWVCEEEIIITVPEEEEWVCVPEEGETPNEETEVPVEEVEVPAGETEGPLGEWPNEWVEIIEESNEEEQQEESVVVVIQDPTN